VSESQPSLLEAQIAAATLGELRTGSEAAKKILLDVTRLLRAGTPLHRTPILRRASMSNLDEAKGRAKRAAGELTGDEKLKREGTADKAAGKAKEVDKAREKTDSLLEND
jgi:uncharacterized protein YjbJ (UPF0337 family)